MDHPALKRPWFYPVAGLATLRSLRVSLWRLLVTPRKLATHALRTPQPRFPLEKPSSYAYLLALYARAVRLVTLAPRLWPRTLWVELRHVVAAQVPLQLLTRLSPLLVATRAQDFRCVVRLMPLRLVPRLVRPSTALVHVPADYPLEP